MSRVKWSKILAPTDFSPHSHRALHAARDLAADHGAELIVLHVVVDALPALLPDVAGFRYDEISESLADRALEMLPEFFPQGERGDLSVDFRIAFGVPDDEIVRCAESCDVDLVVVGTHGRTGTAHLLIGSVAEKVVRQASCPVLVVR